MCQKTGICGWCQTPTYVFTSLGVCPECDVQAEELARHYDEEMRLFRALENVLVVGMLDSLDAVRQRWATVPRFTVLGAQVEFWELTPKAQGVRVCLN